MSQKYKDIKLNYIIGDIRDISRVQQIIQKLDPHIIIIASAMKHIDKCEFDVNEALLTNTIGVLNVCKSVQNTFNVSKRLENVVFISTDKACSPTNVYGMSKSLSERVIIEYSLNMKNTKIKFTNCRYGNVLDSRGSIIPKLKNSISDTYYLNNIEMTRFVMTQEQAVELIMYSILKGQTGETIIPKLKSMKIKDLFEIFSEKYNKKIEMSKIRPGEKIHEELLNIEELYRTTTNNSYYIIHPSYNVIKSTLETKSSYSSDIDIMTKEFLTNYLSELNLL
jgi:FlaA1/EpsC-like NDP-sugar epimerase